MAISPPAGTGCPSNLNSPQMPHMLDHRVALHEYRIGQEDVFEPERPLRRPAPRGRSAPWRQRLAVVRLVNVEDHDARRIDRRRPRACGAAADQRLVPLAAVPMIFDLGAIFERDLDRDAASVLE